MDTRNFALCRDCETSPHFPLGFTRSPALREGRKQSIAQRPLDADVVIDEQIDESNLSVENAEYIHTALQRIAADHREVLILRFLEQMSYEEIAKVTGCPPGTVASRIHHAKRALREGSAAEFLWSSLT